MHAHIRKCLVGHLGEAGQGMRILYGGSVKPANAKPILALENVNGALVGAPASRHRSSWALFQRQRPQVAKR